MNNREYVVSPQQAKAIKQCGFNINLWRGVNYIERIPDSEKEEWDEEECQWVTTYDINSYPKLRLDQAMRWLREVHKISIEPTCNAVAQWNVNVCTICVCGEVLWSKIGLDTYESALSAGIDAALELIGRRMDSDEAQILCGGLLCSRLADIFGGDTDMAASLHNRLNN